jgi:hypothetical protein
VIGKDMFEKNSSHNDFSFTLTMRQLSLAIAGLLAFSFFVFIGGYFLGQKRAAEDFAYRADQDSLADQIYSSMCVLYDPKEEEESESAAEEADTSETESAGESSEPSEVKDETMQEVAAQPVVAQKKYQAVLSGFPATHLADAKQLIARLHTKGYSAELVEHTSTHKKITKKWYQVVAKGAQAYLEKSKSQLAKIAKIGHLKEQSIKIEPCA